MRLRPPKVRYSSLFIKKHHSGCTIFIINEVPSASYTKNKEPRPEAYIVKSSLDKLLGKFRPPFCGLLTTIKSMSKPIHRSFHPEDRRYPKASEAIKFITVISISRYILCLPVEAKSFILKLFYRPLIRL